MSYKIVALLDSDIVSLKESIDNYLLHMPHGVLGPESEVVANKITELQEVRKRLGAQVTVGSFDELDRFVTRLENNHLEGDEKAIQLLQWLYELQRYRRNR